jgi:carboxypeptidase Taq
MSEERFQELKDRLRELDDIRRSAFILHWDLETHMPPGGAELRAEQLGTLAGIHHELFTADDIGELLEELRSWAEALPYESDEASLIRVTGRDYARARKVPATLRADLVRAGANGAQVWRRAREANDYAVFQPALERNLELQAQYIACFNGGAEPYDVLLEEVEPGLTTEDVAEVFARLREELAPLVAAIEPPRDPPLELGLDGAGRKAAVQRVLEGIGFDRSWGRVDNSVHPFMTNFAIDDIRLTVYEQGDLRAVYAALHEFGHGLYEHGIDPALERTPLASGASGAMHESQSLLWENRVGRSEPFSRWLGGVLGVDAAELYRTANRVERSLIRVDADAVTYSLHVVFRFELERALVSGKLEARDLREAWNESVRELLGVAVPDDLRGVLQDMHWADTHMGVFPSYALGHVASAQIWERARGELPGLEDGFARGEFEALQEWLRENLHRHGRKFGTVETLERATGSGFDPEPLLRYVRETLEVAEATGRSKA